MVAVRAAALLRATLRQRMRRLVDHFRASKLADCPVASLADPLDDGERAEVLRFFRAIGCVGATLPDALERVAEDLIDATVTQTELAAAAKSKPRECEAVLGRRYVRELVPWFGHRSNLGVDLSHETGEGPRASAKAIFAWLLLQHMAEATGPDELPAPEATGTPEPDLAPSAKAQIYRPWNGRAEQDVLAIAIREVDAGRSKRLLAMPSTWEADHYAGAAVELHDEDPEALLYYESIADEVFLRAGGQRVRLKVTPEGGGYDAAIIGALKECWRSWLGLRVWCVILCEAAEQGLSPRFTLTMDRVLDRMGAGRKQRGDPAFKLQISKAIAAATRLQLGVRDGDQYQYLNLAHDLDGTMRRAPDGSFTIMERMTIQLHPLIYRGCRTPSGRRGRTYWLLPHDFTTLSHHSAGPAYALALQLVCRFRYELRKGTEAAVRLSGRSLYAMADIKRPPKNPGRAADRLRAALETLQRRGVIGGYRWDSHSWTLGGVCELWPHPHTTDRVVHKITPTTERFAPALVTGADLATWIEAEDLTRTAAAKRLGVSRNSIIRALRVHEAPLPGAVRRAATTRA